MTRIALFSLAPLLAAPISPLFAQRALTATREFSISADQQKLSTILPIWVSEKGVIAVPQSQDKQIRFFETKGTPVGTFGRAGDGPGEFHDVHIGGWIGDTVWVVDQQTKRITYIGPNQKLLRTSPVPATLLPPGNRTERVPSFAGDVFPASVFPDGSLLLIVNSRTIPSWLPVTPGIRFLAQTTLDGHFKRVVYMLGAAPSTACNMMRDTCPHPIGTNSIGHGIVFATPVEMADAVAHYRVVSVSLESGDTTYNRNYQSIPVNIPAFIRDSVEKKMNTLLSLANLPQALRNDIQGTRIPIHYPPIIEMQSSPDGAVWLEERTASTTMHHWLILDPKGNPIGTVDIPLRIKILAVTRDTFWGTDTNADGLQDVVRYRVK